MRCTLAYPMPTVAAPDLSAVALDRTGLSGDYFDTMARFAREHWWYRARARWMEEALSAVDPRRGWAVDVGCGTGAALESLRRLGFASAVGSDLSPVALARARTVTGERALFNAYAEHLPPADWAASCLVSMDVIEHLDDDVRALREYTRVLEPGGVVLLTVPAYQGLFSYHDVRAGHRRRYSARRLRAAAAEAGIEVVRLTYFNSFLVVPAALLRRTPLHRFLAQTDEETSYGHPLVNRLLLAVAGVECRVGRRVRIPCVLSVLLVGRLR
ncbi:class I SAM-dependent methyltransferase [soil metagenome]